jgi:undecaprenyl-diphosphatase
VRLSSVTFFCQKHFKLLLALLLFGLAVVELASLHPLMAYDLMAHDWMQGFRSCALDRAALFLKYWTTTPYPTVVFAVFLASWLAYGKHWQSLASFAIIVIGGALLSEWFKELVARPRPSALWFVQDGNSFPSGHVTTASTIFGAAYYCIGKPNIARPWHRALLLIFFSALVLLIAFQRIYFTHHWVSDAVGGGLLGIGWCFFVIDRFGRYVTMRSIRTWRLYLPSVSSPYICFPTSASAVPRQLPYASHPRSPSISPLTHRIWSKDVIGASQPGGYRIPFGTFFSRRRSSVSR